MRERLLPLAVLVTIISVCVLGQVDIVDAAKKKPKPQPTEILVIKLVDVPTSSIQSTGSPGPDLTLNGRLHLQSQALLDGDTPIGFRLHTNLMDAFASSADGTETYVAVGASDGIPADCEGPCLPSSWTLTFRLVPRGSTGQFNLLFALIVDTVYTADGSLLTACVVGQDSCGIIP
jgi:hypothetical protein